MTVTSVPKAVPADIAEATLWRSIPTSWVCSAKDGPWPGQPFVSGYAWSHPGGLQVLESASIEPDGRLWHHVSVSRRSSCPSWNEMCLVHRLFIGEEIEAYQIHVPKARWVSVHPYCLHLWACLDAPNGLLPHFEAVRPIGHI